MILIYISVVITLAQVPALFKEAVNELLESTDSGAVIADSKSFPKTHFTIG